MASSLTEDALSNQEDAAELLYYVAEELRLPIAPGAPQVRFVLCVGLDFRCRRPCQEDELGAPRGRARLLRTRTREFVKQRFGLACNRSNLP